jgi:Protein of unknown function (DUF3035)
LARTIIRTGILALAAVTMSGCVLIDGSHRTGPDEFGVVTRAPLSQPPDYALRPPRTGAQRPNEVTPRDEARSQLLNVSARGSESPYATRGGVGAADGANGADGGAQKDGLTRGEQALLKQADALNVDPEIRVVVDRESGRVKEDDSLVDKLVFWKSSKKSPGDKTIDAQREADRLRRNAALGIPPTENEPKGR